MIHSLEVINSKNESILLELRDPWKTGLAILSIEGLGPPKANINSTELASTDGAVVSYARVTSRNIVITLAMLPFPDVETVRQKTYRYFPIKQEVKLRFVLDNVTVETSGYVESNEPDIFSDSERTSISIICPDPYMYEPDNTVVSFSSIVPEFEFDFSNESTSDNLLEMSSIRLKENVDVQYDGNVPTGMFIRITSTKNVDSISIVDVNEKTFMTIDIRKIGVLTGKPFGKGDEILLSTYRGRRSAILRREDEYTNVINCIAKNSKWFQITPGINSYSYTTIPESGKFDVSVHFEYHKAYGGV